MVQSANAEADPPDRRRSTPRPTGCAGECDIYVDNKLAQFEEYLNGTLRSVSRGRHQLQHRGRLRTTTSSISPGPQGSLSA